MKSRKKEPFRLVTISCMYIFIEKPVNCWMGFHKIWQWGILLKFIDTPILIIIAEQNRHFTWRSTCISLCILSVTHYVFIEGKNVSSRSHRENMEPTFYAQYTFCVGNEHTQNCYSMCTFCNLYFFLWVAVQYVYLHYGVQVQQMVQDGKDKCDMFSNVCNTGDLDANRPVPFRLTPNILEYLSTIGINGPLTASMIAAARCLVQPSFKVQTILRAILRDEMIAGHRKVRTDCCALWHEALRQMWAVDTCQQTEPNSLSPLPQTSVSQSEPCIFTPHMLKILFSIVFHSVP